MVGRYSFLKFGMKLLMCCVINLMWLSCCSMLIWKCYLMLLMLMVYVKLVFFLLLKILWDWGVIIGISKWIIFLVLIGFWFNLCNVLCICIIGFWLIFMCKLFFFSLIRVWKYLLILSFWCFVVNLVNSFLFLMDWLFFWLLVEIELMFVLLIVLLLIWGLFVEDWEILGEVMNLIFVGMNCLFRMFVVWEFCVLLLFVLFLWCCIY